MINSPKKIYSILLLSMILTACSDGNNDTISDISSEKNTVSEHTQSETSVIEEANEKQVMYQNESIGLTIYEASGWQKGKETQSDSINVMFNNDKAKAIVTFINSGKSFEEIKSELLVGAGNIEVLAEAEDQLSFKSKLKSSIRTDIYLKKNGDRTFIFTIMTPVKNYEQSKKNIEGFLNNIEIN